MSKHGQEVVAVVLVKEETGRLGSQPAREEDGARDGELLTTREDKI